MSFLLFNTYIRIISCNRGDTARRVCRVTYVAQQGLDAKGADRQRGKQGDGFLAAPRRPARPNS